MAVRLSSQTSGNLGSGFEVDAAQLILECKRRVAAAETDPTAAQRHLAMPSVLEGVGNGHANDAWQTFLNGLALGIDAELADAIMCTT